MFVLILLRLPHQ